ncbi:unnamed protein product [Mytilus coruscus]|uniref:Uncharacterized protein n=1 Tax=Mytilus coruscus TaxID=42192 RepID=A0A6J8AJR3_MYTCO|nr:unnamed protein product [Mytilus coruscus]
MVILDNFTTTSEYSLVIIFLSIISLSSADYDLVNGETGKYRWFDTAAQIYRVCCYCPIEAVGFGPKNDYFQRYHDEDGDFCNPTDDEMNQTGKYPFCICEHKMGLKPEFIGCVLPNKSHVSHVEWTCDNVFTSLNVSVYTTCNPRCTKDSMVLVSPGAQSYRCGENKTWDSQPKFVYCQDKTEGCVLPNKSHVSHVEWTCDNVFTSLNVSVYTTCNPKCSKDSMVLVNPGAQSYRCGENKTWDSQPEFVYCQDKTEGCVLPNKSHVSHVEWTCDNVFTSLNVSVYTTCNPRCTKDSMVLVNPGAQSYRCGENKTWDSQPEFVYCQDKTEGCVLPNKSHVSHVEWTCDNVFTSLNVSVTSNTTCNPRCTKDSMALVNPDAQSYRCGENKIWDKQPEFVYCQEKTEDVTENWIYMVIVIVPSSFIIAIILLITYRQRLWNHFCLQPKKQICSSSEKSSASKMEMIAISIDATIPKSYNGETNDNMTCETQLSDTDVHSNSCSINMDTINQANYENLGGASVTEIDEDEERKSIPYSLIDAKMNSCVARLEKDIIKEAYVPLMSNNHDLKPAQPLLVKVSGLRERYRDGEIYYSVIRGSEVIIVSQIVETDSDFIIDREYDEHKLNYYKIRSASKNNEGVYKWQLKGNNKIRPEPVGGSTVSLPFISLDLDSIETVEEKVMNGGCPGSPALPCLPERNSPFSSTRFIGTTSSERYDGSTENSFNCAISSVGQNDITEIEIESVMKKCNRCNEHLISALDDFNSSKYLNNICHMLDPNTKNDSQCWIGFVKFYGIIEGYRIDNIKYHKKGNPEDGHMQYILQQYLPPHDFRIGHLVYYFSQKDSRREDVLLEIKKFHKNCTFCNIYINST